ncbi:MAG TPA: hypothetical protein VKE70_32740 [Candidatus Solibacter sp.]|nr:hypothetical protein [Candidatus Solibacter sp.]
MAEFRQILALVAGLLVDLWIGGTGVLVLILIARGKIDLSRLISEPNGDASMSRFQLLIFTLVIGLSVFVVTASANPPAFPDIPGSILSLLGISASSFLVSKGIQFSNPEGIHDHKLDVTPAAVAVAVGAKQTFAAKLDGQSATIAKWSVPDAQYGTIDNQGVYTAIKTPPAGHPVIVSAETADGTVGAAAVL